MGDMAFSLLTPMRNKYFEQFSLLVLCHSSYLKTMKTDTIIYKGEKNEIGYLPYTKHKNQFCMDKSLYVEYNKSLKLLEFYRWAMFLTMDFLNNISKYACQKIKAWEIQRH